MRAAVVFDAGAGFVVTDVQRRAPREHEVVVRVRASGLCQTDLSLASGEFGQSFPVVLGHEGAGEVIEVGSAQTGWSVGDRVLANWVPSCGRCYACERGQPYICRTRARSADRTGSDDLTVDGRPVVVGLGVASFAEEMLLPSSALLPLADDIPFTTAALLGCAVPTGMGAALRAGGATPGDTVVVTGCGPIGLSAILGAKVAGARVIVGVDPSASRRAAAERLGATVALAPEELASELPPGVDPGGFDLAIDSVAHPGTIRASWDRARRGGRVVIVGAGRDAAVTFSAQELFHDEKTLRGSYFGSGDQRREVPAMTDLWRAGLLDVDGLVDAVVPLDEIGDVAARQARGEIVRAVLVP